MFCQRGEEMREPGIIMSFLIGSTSDMRMQSLRKAFKARTASKKRMIFFSQGNYPPLWMKYEQNHRKISRDRGQGPVRDGHYLCASEQRAERLSEIPGMFPETRKGLPGEQLQAGQRNDDILYQ